MVFNKKKLGVYVALRVLFLWITLLILVFFVLKKQWIYVAITVPFVIWAVNYFIRYAFRIHKDIEEFTEAVRYRDFTRHYALQQSPIFLQPLRAGFNDINDAFKAVMRNKEVQRQYLQKILELIDTGILCFDTESGDILRMNEALKEMLDIPSLKNVEKLSQRKAEVCSIIRAMKNGDSRVIDLKKETGTKKVLLNMTAFQTNGKVIKLLSFQDISEAMDQTEALAWQKLLSVMTHEIMNSVAPIASLADTLKARLRQPSENDLRMEDLELGISTIQRRSEGLIKFAGLYRNLNKISQLDKTHFPVGVLFDSINQLMRPMLKQKGIGLEILLPHASLMLEADRNLLEQVLINLILNAVEAVKGCPDPQIILSAGEGENGKALLSVKDNGKGIPEELMDRIFIPFFSIRKNGNGIGLSLCKQIMLLHGGNVRVDSEEGNYTCFYLIFKKRLPV